MEACGTGLIDLWTQRRCRLGIRHVYNELCDCGHSCLCHSANGLLDV